MLRLAPWLAALALTLLVAAKFDPVTGFTSLIRFGEYWQDRRMPAVAALAPATAPASAGYDGQFYAQIALDPTLRDPALETVLDGPAYRARRILVPALAYATGAGKPAWILQTYALLNVAGWFALAWLLWRQIAPRDGRDLARWLACMFSMGVLDSVRQSLVDLPALLCLVLAVQAHARTLPRAALWLSLGHLAKETNLLGSLALGAHRSFLRARPLTWLALTVVPLGLWLVYVHLRFSGASAQTGAGNFTWPVLGALEQLTLSAREVLRGDFDSRHTFALVAIPGLFLQFIVLLRHRQPDEAWWRIGIAYGVLLLFLGSWVWSGYWAALRAVLPLTIAFNLLLPANRAFWPLLIAGNLTVLHAVWRFL